MMLALNIGLAIGLFVLSLLVFLMVRQVGVLTRRIDEGLKGGLEPLPAGTALPVRDVAAYGPDPRLRLPLDGGPETYLLFAAFSCPVCRPLLENLVRLDAALSARLVVLLLDKGASVPERAEFRLLQENGFRLADGTPAAAAFRIQRTPFVYVADADGVVRDAEHIANFSHLVEVLSRKVRPVPQTKEEVEHVPSR